MRTFTLAAITLAASNRAFAFDSYGGFASPDNSGRSSPIPDIVEPVVSPVIAPVSRGQLVAGNPDSDRSTRFDATGVARPTAPAISSLAVLTHGKPDSGTGGRLGVGPDAEPMVEEGDTIAAENAVVGGGV
jgi:hypothetical protein